MKTGLTKLEEKAIMAMAEKAAATPPPGNRYTREDRVMIVYSALCGMFRLSKRKKLTNLNDRQ